jgi:hypothetical protein
LKGVQHGCRKVSTFLREDEVLAVFEDMSESDIGNSESECDSEREVSESEVDAEEICHNLEINSPENAAQCIKRRRTAGPSLQWQRGNFVPKIHDFANQNSGISANLDGNCSVFDLFILFLSFQIMQHIAEQTNSYYKFLCQKLQPTPHFHLQSWAETTAEELYICDI